MWYGISGYSLEMRYILLNVLKSNLYEKTTTDYSTKYNSQSGFVWKLTEPHYIVCRVWFIMKCTFYKGIEKKLIKQVIYQ